MIALAAIFLHEPARPRDLVLHPIRLRPRLHHDLDRRAVLALRVDPAAPLRPRHGRRLRKQFHYTKQFLVRHRDSHAAGVRARARTWSKICYLLNSCQVF